MGANRKRLSSISKAQSVQKIGKFWDAHDFTDYDNPNAPDVKFKVTSSVPVDEELLAKLEKQAHRRGVKVETLVNLWLQQKLSEETKRAA